MGVTVGVRCRSKADRCNGKTDSHASRDATEAGPLSGGRHGVPGRGQGPDRVNKRCVQRLHVQTEAARYQCGHVPGRDAVRGSGAGARQPPDGEAGRRPVRARVDRADVRGRVRQGRARGPVARPDPRDAAADPGAVRGPSDGPARRPDRPGGGALGARTGLPRQARDGQALARLGPWRARGGASSRPCRRERGGRSDRRGLAEEPEGPGASAGVAVRGRSRGARGGRGVGGRSGRQRRRFASRR